MGDLEIMKITLERVNQATHLRAYNEEGASADMDGAPKIGGEGKGMRPMQMLLTALGGCSAMDVISLLEKMRQPLEDLKMEVDGEREEGVHPSLFTKINIHYTLYGDIDVKKAERAIELSVERYCSVGKTIEKTAEITWSYEIIRPEA